MNTANIIVTAKIQNLQDLYGVELGVLEPEQVRSVEVTNALVDTGATSLMAPSALIQKLGLRPFRKRQARTSAGIIDLQTYEAVRLSVHGRDFLCEVAEIRDDRPVLIGRIPLAGLDLIVDPVGPRLIGNSDHGGEHMIEVYSFLKK